MEQKDGRWIIEKTQLRYFTEYKIQMYTIERQKEFEAEMMKLLSFYTEINKSIIVTFTCSQNIHVFRTNGATKPRKPFFQHSTIEEAVLQLKSKGIKEPKIIYEE